MNKLILANFKSNKSAAQAHEWLLQVISATNWSACTNCTAAVAPSFVSLKDFSDVIQEKKAPVALAVQDLSPYPAGSYTGAVGVVNMLDLNIRYAILGHSERRAHFAETSSSVAQKVVQATEAGMTPVVCIDEEYLEEQLSLLDPTLIPNCVFAYEPLSAIGTGNTIGVDSVIRVREKIRQISPEALVLYGGSVTDQNVNEYLLVADGVLVGSFALDADNFVKLLTTATGGESRTL